MIHVLATIQIRAGQREQFLAEFAKVVPAVRAEQGCLEYGAAVDIKTAIPSQGPLRDSVVVVVEKWEDEGALAAHLVAPHMNEYRARVRDLVEGMELEVLKPV